jgi:two-component system sensor histidine kinase QseC
MRQRQTIEVDAAAPFPVPGDATLLSVLLRNLVDNALRYSPPGAVVKVSVAADAQGTALRVEDSGPGMGEADMRRLGERFFRVLGSDRAGSGLGWSIVRRIAAAQSVQLAVGRSAELGGLSVELRWPALSGPVGRPARD